MAGKIRIGVSKTYEPHGSKPNLITTERRPRAAESGKTEQSDVIPNGTKTAIPLIDNGYYSCPLSSC